MAMHGDLSPEARSRAGRTVEVAAVFAEHAELIVAALPDVPDEHVLVAVVDHTHTFGGTHHVEQASIVERVPQLEGQGGWAMVFTPGASVEDVRRRTEQMAAIAAQRMAAIDRIIARRQAKSG
jgi:hypothetical protein